MDFPYFIAEARDLKTRDLLTGMKSTMLANQEKYVRPKTLRGLYRDLCLFRHIFLDRRMGIQPRTVEELRRAIAAMSDVVHYLLERFYWIRYGDSETVVDLLGELLQLDGHLGKIFDFQQLYIDLSGAKPKKSTSRKRTVETTWNDGAVHNQKEHPTQYFLQHATRVRATFHGQRLAEVPFVQSEHRPHASGLFHQPRTLLQPPCSRTFASPRLLGVLLQHGLFALSRPDDPDVGKLLTGVIGIVLGSGAGEKNAGSHSTTNDHLRQVLDAGNALLRAVGSVDPSCLLFSQDVTRRELVLIVLRLSRPGRLPMLGRRCRGPQELQHLCRRAIRGRLYRGWGLPHGVGLLPLPQPVKDYINLQRD